MWLAGASGSAAVGAPVNMAADTLAGAARRRFRQFRRTDDLSRLVEAATGSVGLTEAELDALGRVLEDREFWTLLGQGTPHELSTKIASCLQSVGGPTAEHPYPAATAITHGLLEFAVADLEPRLYQKVLLARLQRMETDQASALDQALLRQQASMSAVLAGQGDREAELFARVMRQLDRMLDRLPPTAADSSQIAVYLRTLISWLSSDPWPQRRRFGGPALTPAGIERKLRISRAGADEKDLDADDLAGRCERLVVLGGPGSGKTWLAKRTARRCAQKALHALAAGATLAEVELPIYTTCSRLFTAVGDIRSAVVSSALGQIGDMGGSHISAAVGMLLTERNAPTVVVIDSLDEAPGGDERLRQADTLPWRIVLTSRPSSWDGQLAIKDGKEGHKSHCVGELRPLRYPDDVIPFVRMWFTLQPERGSAVVAQIAQSAGLQVSATVPLMLAMYCVIGGRDEALPEFHRDLYDKVLRCLLTGHWRLSDSHHTTETDTAACLKQLTEWAWEGAVSDPVSGIGMWADEISTVSSPLDQADREAVDHVAVPLGPPDLYLDTVPRRFIHRSIREHLIAARIAALPVDEAIEALLPHLWYDPDWEYPSAAAIAGHPQRSDLLSSLISHAAGSNHVADDIAAVDAGGEFRALLARIASESRESDWQPQVAAIIGQARVELARAARSGHLSKAAHWPTWNQLARKKLLSRISELAIFCRDHEAAAFARELTQLDPSEEERSFALEALINRLPSDFTDPLFSPLDITSAIADFAETADEKQRARKALLGIFSGPPNETRSVVARSAIKLLVKLAGTAEEKRQVREVLLNRLATSHHFFQAEPLVYALLWFDPTDQDKHRARRTLLSSMPGQTDSWNVGHLVSDLTLLDPTADEKRLARQVLLSLMSGRTDRWDIENLTSALAQLDPPADEKQQIRRALLSKMPAKTGSWKSEELARALVQPDPANDEDPREALLTKMPAKTSHEDIKTLVSALLKLAATVGEKYRAKEALLSIMTTHHGARAPKITAAALLRLDPTADEKGRARQALLSLMTAETTISWGIADLADALAQLDPTADERRRARYALLKKMASNALPWEGNTLVELTVTEEEKRQVREALLGLASAVGGFGTEARKLMDVLAQFDPTVDDIRAWRGWNKPPSPRLLAAARRNSTLESWLAALPSLPGLMHLRTLW